MTINAINITNLDATKPFSLDIRIDDRRQIRRLIPAAGTVNVADQATFAEINGNPQLLALRTGAAPKVSVAVVAGIGLDDMAAIPLMRKTVAADSTVSAVAAETAYTPITIPANALGTLRRRIKWEALIHVINQNGSDTLQIQVKLGAAGVAGVLLVDGTAVVVDPNDVIRLSGTIDIRTLGAGTAGKFNAWSLIQTSPNATADVETAVLAGNLDTTLDRNLTITATWSSNNAANQSALRFFEASVLQA